MSVVSRPVWLQLAACRGEEDELSASDFKADLVSSSFSIVFFFGFCFTAKQIRRGKKKKSKHARG